MLAAAVSDYSGWSAATIDHYHTMTDDHRLFELENGLMADVELGGGFFGLPITSDETDFLCQPLSSDPVLEFAFYNGGEADCPISQDAEGVSGADVAAPAHKNHAHNAYERTRRRKLNELYSTLRSLLPHASRQKKLSIPSTVAQVLAYIPELQSRITELTKRKEELQSSAARRSQGNGADVVYNKINSTTTAGSYPVVSACSVGNREIMIQVCYLTATAPSSGGVVSRILACVESEGFRLINASTSRIDDNRMSCRLHLQARCATDGKDSDLTYMLENKVRDVLESGSPLGFLPRME